MKKILSVLTFLLFLVIPSTLACEDPLTCTDMRLALSIAGNLELYSKSPVSSVDWVKVYLNYVPKDDYRQSVVSLDTSPTPFYQDDNEIVFYWEKPAISQKTYSLNAVIDTDSDYLEIRNKVVMPPRNIPKDSYVYVQPSNLIDINEDIRRKASSLAAGETDEFIVVSRLAEWVNQNVEYDLNTITAEASKPASWVYANKVGVCDEITNLFIAMCRSLGIPAKFVSGVSYTNLPGFDNPWGPHGWAEVYFEGVGWVPFDATYGQYGYVDAGHIKLKESVDGDKSTVEFEWRSINVDITPGEIKTDVDIIEKSGEYPERVLILSYPYLENVEFGSYNIIIGEVSNFEDFYVAKEFSLSVPKEIKVLSAKKQFAILRPKEKANLYWIIKVDEGLSKNYRYTFPSTIYTQQNESANSEFFVKKGETYLSYDFVISYLEERNNLLQKPYSEAVDLDCDYKDRIRFGENQNISCVIKNNGDETLKAIKVCHLTCLQSFDLPSGAQKSFGFIQNYANVGPSSLIITAKNELIAKYAYINILVFDKPKIIIYNITNPGNVNFKDEVDISFFIKKD